LIVGPSGAGKSTILNHQFGNETMVDWGNQSVIDDFSADNKIDEIAAACSAVGFNTIPAWLRPYGVLSNGEKFRVTLARLLLDTPNDTPIVIDEFTSVVDRQVAAIGANAVQKWVRKQDRQFVAATCHYDVIDWLQPDWVIDAAKREFSWRSVQPRPKINIEIRSVPYDTWRLFAPYHYLTANLHRAARCYAAFINNEPVAFAGVLHRPHPKAKNIIGLSRLVTLPDWQGLGAAFVLSDALGACYKTAGKRFRTYPAHPSLIRSYDRSKNYALKQKPGYQGTNGANYDKTTMRQSGNSKGVTHGPNAQIVEAWRHGSRPCAVFEYVGPEWNDKAEAIRFINKAHNK
jgi:energy-coupling factor transporter ATP-binding protein EcfA2